MFESCLAAAAAAAGGVDQVTGGKPGDGRCPGPTLTAKGFIDYKTPNALQVRN